MSMSSSGTEKCFTDAADILFDSRIRYDASFFDSVNP